MRNVSDCKEHCFGLNVGRSGNTSRQRELGNHTARIEERKVKMEHVVYLLPARGG